MAWVLLVVGLSQFLAPCRQLCTGIFRWLDLHDAIAGLRDRTSAVLNLTLCTLPRQQQLLLAKLSVFPSNFTVVGAGAVLGFSEARAYSLMRVFYRHGLVMRGSSTNLFSLHMAVRKASAALGGEAVATHGQSHFVIYVFQQLDQWARMFYTPAWELPLSLAREAGPDILAAFELAGKLAAQQSQPQASMLDAILAVDAALVHKLLSCAGYRKGTWDQLQHLHGSINGRPGQQVAAALLLRCMSVEDYDAAVKAHDLCCQALGSGHPCSIACVHAMAEGQAKLHRYQEAEALLRDAYETRLRVMGRLAPATWMSLQELANCIGSVRLLPAKAEPLWSELLEVLQQVLGDHPDTLRARVGLASCLTNLGKLSEAEVLYRESLASRQRVLGPEHPDSISSVNNLASCLKDQGKLSEAEVLYRESLASRQRVLGPDHPDSINSVNNLAVCLSNQGKLFEAEVLYRESVSSLQRVLGPDHPDSISSINNLAVCLADQGNLSEAVVLFRESLASRQRVLGPDHPDSMSSVSNLAGCLTKQGNLSKAEVLYRESLASRQRVLGPDHPGSISSVNNLAVCLDDQGKLSEAEFLYRESLASRQSVLGLDHPDSISSINNLAICLKNQGKLSDAEVLFRESLASRQRVLGPDFPHSISSANKLAICLKKQEKLA
ncbi:hypothetical protein DUNSADRAFT_4385 [Dunaliella salina]|uniref:Kinesin light chain n=1 Tax=Dunaliella salina TaxID=3046 RepID=A0ABQ7GSB5_DUNSA|nr:hypothetical protein DUNSADRAFT_4385 [Dunaliella salina]|eukprot:KAF5837470.1 hypothetical protein DUNSADRAFT_4385 [Dunaliella salina]